MASAGMTGIRDKVVAACLTGAVVVVVGYASGIGLRPMASTAPQALPPAAPAVPHGDHAHAEPHADDHGHSDSHGDSHADSHGMSHTMADAGHAHGASHLASASHPGGHETGGHHDIGAHDQPHDDHTGTHPPDDDHENHEDHGGQHPPPGGPPEDEPGPGCEEELLGSLLDDLLGPLTGLTDSCDRRDETRTGS